jgi:hypothetical protein
LKGSAGLQQGGCFHFVLLYLAGAGLILTSILNFGLGGVGRGGLEEGFEDGLF